MLVAALWCWMWGRGLTGSNGTCCTLCQFSVTSLATHNQIGPFWCWFPGGWACVCSRTLWVSPMNSPVRLGVSPAATSIPAGVFSQWFGALFPCTGTLGCAICHLFHQLLPRWPAAALPTLLHNLPPRWLCLPAPPCCESSPPSYPSLPLLLVWMNVSTPWLSDFHTVQFSVSSGCFCFQIVVVLLWVVWGGTVCHPMPSSWLEVQKSIFKEFWGEIHSKGSRIQEWRAWVSKHTLINRSTKFESNIVFCVHVFVLVKRKEHFY